MNLPYPFQLDTVVFRNSLSAWIVAISVSIAISLILQVIKAIFSHRLQKLAKSTDTKFDDVLSIILSKTRYYFLLLIGFYFGIKLLTLTPKADLYSYRLFIILFSLQIIAWGNALTEFFLYHRREDVSDSVITTTTFGVIGFVAKLVLWSIVLLIMLSNLGVNITAVITGLGVGGIAIALATQKILGDIFSSFIIVFDKPFEVGDFIVINEFRGIVERIGLKTTRLRSITGEEIIIPNSNMIDSRIQNFKRMEERRVQFTIGVEYSTKKEHLEAIPNEVKQIIESIDRTRFEYCVFRNLGEFSLSFEVAYFVLEREFQTFTEIHNQVNLKLIDRFRTFGIRFAFPTQTIHLHHTPITTT